MEEQSHHSEGTESRSSRQLGISGHDLKEALTPVSFFCIPFLSLTSFEKLFMLVYAVLEVLELAYKYNRLVYPSYAIITELISFSGFLLTQPIRFYFAEKGVHNQHPNLLIWYAVVTFLSFLGFIFFLRLQLYVTFLEVIINSIGLGFLGVGLGLSIWLFLVFYQRRRIV